MLHSSPSSFTELVDHVKQALMITRNLHLYSLMDLIKQQTPKSVDSKELPSWSAEMLELAPSASMPPFDDWRPSLRNIIIKSIPAALLMVLRDDEELSAYLVTKGLQIAEDGSSHLVKFQPQQADQPDDPESDPGPQGGLRLV